MLQGIDVSAWQGEINWSKVASDTQIRFAFLKATEGGHLVEQTSKGYLDPSFESNWINANNAGLFVGAYHFARVSHMTGAGRYALLDDARSEASWFWTVLQDAQWERTQHLPPVLDVEWDRRAEDQGITAQQTLAWTLAFLAELTGLCGRRPLVYCGPNFWRYRLRQDERLNRYPLWVTDINQPPGQPKRMGAWAWLFHQYSFTGNVAGITGDVDLNLFRGDEAALANFIGANGPFGAFVPFDWTPPCELGLPTLDLRSAAPQGDAVERLQAMLLAHGWGPEGLVDPRSGLPDGVGGRLTREALRRFQAAVGLTPDSVVGPKTWWALLRYGIAG